MIKFLVWRKRMDNKWNFEIMTDSAANLSEDVIRRYGLTILSQTYTIDGVEYRGYEKGEDISAGPVYEMMREKKRDPNIPCKRTGGRTGGGTTFKGGKGHSLYWSVLCVIRHISGCAVYV